jgi:hypothetical protein
MERVVQPELKEKNCSSYNWINWKNADWSLNRGNRWGNNRSWWINNLIGVGTAATAGGAILCIINSVVTPGATRDGNACGGTAIIGSKAGSSTCTPELFLEEVPYMQSPGLGSLLPSWSSGLQASSVVIWLCGMEQKSDRVCQMILVHGSWNKHT